MSRSNVKMGYQGSLSDEEIKGEGNSYSTYYRLLDPRLGRWFSIDPVFQPWQSPYSSMDNNPIWYNDPLGDWVKGAGFWKNVTSSDAKIKAKAYASKNGGNATRKGFGKWDVVRTEETRISNNEGKTRLEYNTEIRSFNKENSNDLTDHGNAFFNFMEVASYGFSHLKGSKDNYGENEGGAEGGNKDYEYKGTIGMVKGLSKGVNNIGIFVTFGSSSWVGPVLGLLSDATDTSLDYKTNNPNADQNLKIRAATFIGGNILDIPIKLIPKKALQQPIKGAINLTGELIEDKTTK